MWAVEQGKVGRRRSRIKRPLLRFLFSHSSSAAAASDTECTLCYATWLVRLM